MSFVIDLTGEETYVEYSDGRRRRLKPPSKKLGKPTVLFGKPVRTEADREAADILANQLYVRPEEER